MDVCDGDGESVGLRKTFFATKIIHLLGILYIQEFLSRKLEVLESLAYRLPPRFTGFYWMIKPEVVVTTQYHSVSLQCTQSSKS